MRMTTNWMWPSRRTPSVFGDDILNDFDRMVDSLMRPTSATNVNFLPSCDIDESKDHYLVSFDMPGVKKDDIQIEVKDNTLMIAGERNKEVKNAEHEGYMRHERSYGKFQRAFTLPGSVDASKIEAHYEDGVLNVAIPKTEASKGRTIEIQSGKGGLFSRLLGTTKSNETKDLKDVTAS